MHRNLESSLVAPGSFMLLLGKKLERRHTRLVAHINEPSTRALGGTSLPYRYLCEHQVMKGKQKQKRKHNAAHKHSPPLKQTWRRLGAGAPLSPLSPNCQERSLTQLMTSIHRHQKLVSARPNIRLELPRWHLRFKLIIPPVSLPIVSRLFPLFYMLALFHRGESRILFERLFTIQIGVSFSSISPPTKLYHKHQPIKCRAFSKPLTPSPRSSVRTPDSMVILAAIWVAGCRLMLRW